MKAAKKAVAALAVSKKPQLSDLAVRAVDSMNDALRMMAEAVSGKLAPQVAVQMFDQVKLAEDAIKTIAGSVRTTLLGLIEKDGRQKTDKGSLELELGEWYLEARPQKTGLDSKKVEALLRTKDIDPEVGMDVEISYSVNETKLQQLVKMKKLTQAELNTCEYELKYSLQRPKKLQSQEFDE